ncbi:hypothetical protein D7Y57_03580 [Stenotrophomonas maltophilia]|jgi:hypothetical protein|nr:hypothetical protein DF40_009185 [Stenotrophomonas maltophilia M30]MBA0233239.1 hypothetical protein [Stenotrophomonas maltophilia]MBA0267278.1 hypothetical protein [Stenotrophomonas maltophilia]MBA0455222.1 hypothetical protein [Stenotrophomonas maltophilia]
MKHLIAALIIFIPLLANASESQARFVVSMSIVGSCRITDEGLAKCTLGMAQPNVAEEVRTVRTPTGEQQTRTVKVITY